MASVGDKKPQISLSWGVVLSQSTFHLVFTCDEYWHNYEVLSQCCWNDHVRCSAAGRTRHSSHRESNWQTHWPRNRR